MTIMKISASFPNGMDAPRQGKWRRGDSDSGLEEDERTGGVPLVVHSKELAGSSLIKKHRKTPRERKETEGRNKDRREEDLGRWLDSVQLVNLRVSWKYLGATVLNPIK